MISPQPAIPCFSLFSPPHLLLDDGASVSTPPPLYHPGLIPHSWSTATILNGLSVLSTSTFSEHSLARALRTGTLPSIAVPSCPSV